MTVNSLVEPESSFAGLRAGEIEITRGTQTTATQRAAFFARTHPRLAPWLAENWHWWFRVGFDSEIEPIVAMARGQLVGHAGTLPVAFRNGKSLDVAVWYLVFAVLPECQGQGLGKRMTQEWMRSVRNPITECNEKSISLFRKYGWEETFETRRFAHVMDPAKLADRLPRPVRIAVPLARPLYRAWLNWGSRSAPRLKPEPVPSRTQDLADLFQPEPAAALEMIRDEAWVRWRVLESPFLFGYRLFHFESAVALVRGFVSDGVRRLHILYVNRPRNNQDQSMLLRGIVRWACEGRVDLIWAIARNSDLVDDLRKSLPREMGVRIAAHNTDREIMSKFLKPGFSIQAIDSDIDLCHPEDTGSAFCWD